MKARGDGTWTIIPRHQSSSRASRRAVSQSSAVQPSRAVDEVRAAALRPSSPCTNALMNLPSMSSACACRSRPMSFAAESVSSPLNTRVGSMSIAGEAGARELRAVVLLLERAGDAADPELDVRGGCRPGPRRGRRRRRRRSGRRASARGTPRRSTRSLSAERLITQLEMMTSTDASGSGMCSISPLRNSTFVSPDVRWFSRASASISSVMSRP